MYFWAGVCFSASGGRTAAFLQCAADKHLKLRQIRPQLGGVRAQCAAGRYRALARLARRYRVRLKIEKRQGLYFRLRPFLRRTGLFVGVLVFAVLFVLLRQLVWQMQFVNFTVGQTARAVQTLREECGITAGAYVTQELLAQGEAALLKADDSFSWVSLNFSGGRLTIEGTAAKDAPEILSGIEGDVTAQVGGTIVSVNVKMGTALVRVGDEVQEGQVLLSAARVEHDNETLMYSQVLGEVRAEFTCTYETKIPLTTYANLPTSGSDTQMTFAMGDWALTPWAWGEGIANIVAQATGENSTQAAQAAGARDTSTAQYVTQSTRQLEVLGYGLPITVYETRTFALETCAVTYTEETALALARYEMSKALYSDFSDVNLLAQEEAYEVIDGVLYYHVDYRITADICAELHT